LILLVNDNESLLFSTGVFCVVRFSVEALSFDEDNDNPLILYTCPFGLVDAASTVFESCFISI
jgi:hypothetical protein